ncbi:endonuclease [Flavobacterium ardleyense]|uniref:Endonuclease n=1 Tax=Flavobacterium ardleyense TaxID=2038737 RepID=A0ABW5Z4H1_9FLAO
MKKNFTLLLVLTSFLALAQPAGYYNAATGTGYALKTQLKKIIDDVNDGLSPEFLHIDRGYGSGTNTNNNGLWTAYKTTDRDLGIGYENDNTIVDMYSENPNATDPYNYNYNTASSGNNGQCGTYSGEGDCYNREHLVPQAYFSHYQIDPMKNDPNFVFPTDGKVNSIRDNYPFGPVSVANYTSGNGSKRGSNVNSGYSAGYNNTVFEPIDEFKGDIARSVLYFATRYEDLLGNFYTGTNVRSKDMFDGSSDKVFSNTFLNILITWHLQDPVSTKEIIRNNAIYAFQSNRNPYIDHPEYVCQIWSATCANLSSDSFALDNNITIYPNPALNNEVYVTATTELKTIVLYNVNGQIIQEIKNPSKVENNTYKVSNLPKGFYLMQLGTENASTTKKLIVN